MEGEIGSQDSNRYTTLVPVVLSIVSHSIPGVEATQMSIKG